MPRERSGWDHSPSFRKEVEAMGNRVYDLLADSFFPMSFKQIAEALEIDPNQRGRGDPADILSLAISSLQIYPIGRPVVECAFHKEPPPELDPDLCTTGPGTYGYYLAENAERLEKMGRLSPKLDVGFRVPTRRKEKRRPLTPEERDEFLRKLIEKSIIRDQNS